MLCIPAATTTSPSCHSHENRAAFRDFPEGPLPGCPWAVAEFGLEVPGRCRENPRGAQRPLRLSSAQGLSPALIAQLMWEKAPKSHFSAPKGKQSRAGCSH